MQADNSKQHGATQAAYTCPTSPWTELFQNAPRQQAEPSVFDSEDQRPTHDALSDIYNRGSE